MEPEKLVVDWQTVYHLCRHIATEVVKPDLIIGIAAGGLIPTAMIAKRLKVYNIDHIGIRSYGEDKKRGNIELYHEPNLRLVPEHAKILVIDDLLDSGSSFEYVETYLEELGYSNIQCASLHFKVKHDDTQYKPRNFVCGSKCGDVWVSYPWET